MFSELLAVATLGADLWSQKQNRKSQESMNEAQLAERKATRDDVKRYGDRAITAIKPGYDIVRDILGQQQETVPGYLQEMAQPQFELIDKSSLAGQEVALAGLMAQNAAIMGTPIDYSGLQPRSLDFDYNAAIQASAPQPLDLSAINGPMALQGQTTPTGYDAYGPGQMAFDNMSPEQLQMMEQMGQINDKMRMAAFQGYY